VLHQILAYVVDVNSIVDDVRTIEISADVSLISCEDIGLAVNLGKE
jgi:hypothetical protein